MPGTKEAMEIFRKKLEKLNKEQMAVMLKQLTQEKKRRKSKKKSSKK
jgi:uncharacterized membrane protein (DUF106 family)